MEVNAQKKMAHVAANDTGQEAKTPDKDTGFPQIPEGGDLEKPPIKANARNKKNKPERNGAGNTLIARIEADLKERYSIRYNLLKNAVEIKTNDGDKWADVDERRAKQIEAELLHKGYARVNYTLNVILSNAEEFDPVTDYLQTLPSWDGQTDYIGQLANFVEVDKERRDWFNRMFKKHLVRLLACAIGEIPFNKHCLVLVSGQNDGKTSFLRYLCPLPWREYYTEDVDFENKDGLIALARNLFINLDELRNLSRQDINKVKSYLSKDSIKARLPFDRRETKLKRRASFFGSTNNAEFLTDETGNVRWLVFEIKGVKHDNGGNHGYCRIDINQVWAQAYGLLKKRYPYQLTREEIERSEGFNKAHTKKPLEYELILKYYDQSTNRADFQTASDIKRRLEIQTLGKLSNPENIGKALRMLGIDRIAKKVNGQTVYGYLLKAVEEKDWGAIEEK